MFLGCRNKSFIWPAINLTKRKKYFRRIGEVVEVSLCNCFICIIILFGEMIERNNLHVGEDFLHPEVILLLLLFLTYFTTVVFRCVLVVDFIGQVLREHRAICTKRLFSRQLVVA